MRMTRWLVAVLGLWQLSAPYALHYAAQSPAAADVILGGLVALASLYGATSRTAWPYRLTAALGLVVLVLPFLLPGGLHATEHVVTGALIFLASIVALLPVQMRA